MYCHPDARCIRAVFGWLYISLQFFTFSNGYILLTIGSIYTKLGDFLKLNLGFMTIG